jgi:hypothetical protein
MLERNKVSLISGEIYTFVEPLNDTVTTQLMGTSHTQTSKSLQNYKPLSSTPDSSTTHSKNWKSYQLSRKLVQCSQNTWYMPKTIYEIENIQAAWIWAGS